MSGLVERQQKAEGSIPPFPRFFFGAKKDRASSLEKEESLLT